MHHFTLCLLLLHASASVVASEFTDASHFIDTCLAQNGTLPCTDYKCLTVHHGLDLRQMDRLVCHSDEECRPEITGFECVPYTSTGYSYCECPRYYGYNATTCSCQKAKLCAYENGTTCHHGMECDDKRCSCASDFASILFEPQGRFCVLPRGTEDPDPAVAVAGGDETGWTASWIVLVLLLIGILGIVIYVVSACTCRDTGDYECEDQKGATTTSLSPEAETHVAAWDLPSMDYLDEEETLKYIRQHEKDRDSVLTSPSPSGSLPESEQSSARYEHHHVNQAYVHDNEYGGGRRRSK